MQPTQDKSKDILRSKKKWKDFHLSDELIQALATDNKNRPTRVQEEVLKIAIDPDRKKFNVLIHAANGVGKTLAFLLPMLNSLKQGHKFAEDKIFKGKMMKNQRYIPQGVIITQSNTLQEQIFNILEAFCKYGIANKHPNLIFTVGKLNSEEHQPGDIIVCQPKSFLNRCTRGNMNLDQCQYVAVDEVDQIFSQDSDTLSTILKNLEDKKPCVFSCSATMKKQFITFYQSNCPNHIKTNVNQMISQDFGHFLTLEGIKNYFWIIEDAEMSYKYVVQEVFKALYGNIKDKKKPQLFMFFNSSEEIYYFQKYFTKEAGDILKEQNEYLRDLNIGQISGTIFLGPEGKMQKGEKINHEPVTVERKREIMRKFENNEINILLSTNIVARGIDVRNACFVINMGVPNERGRKGEINFDSYLHRVGRTGRHNDKGIALTIANGREIENLSAGLMKIHNLTILKMISPQIIAKEVEECMAANSL